MIRWGMCATYAKFVFYTLKCKTYSTLFLNLPD